MWFIYLYLYRYIPLYTGIVQHVRSTAARGSEEGADENGEQSEEERGV